MEKSLKADGHVLSLGRGQWGGLGNGSETNSYTAVEVSNSAYQAYIGAADAAFYSIGSFGSVKGWGYDPIHLNALEPVDIYYTPGDLGF